MSTTLKQKSVWDYIADLSQRVDRLETGGKPLTKVSQTASGTFTIAAGLSANDIAVSIAWTNTDVTVPPKADFAFTIYVDNNNDPDYEWPFGTSLSSGQRNLRFDYFRNRAYMLANPGVTRATLRLTNQDSSQHTYYLYINGVYLTGNSGST